MRRTVLYEGTMEGKDEFQRIVRDLRKILRENARKEVKKRLYIGVDVPD